jgi:hypothetical protein
MSSHPLPRTIWRIRLPFVVLGATVLIVGCGHGLRDVSGKVTMNGKPLTNTIIYFLPEKGPLAQSQLDAEGRYRLTTVGKGYGVLPGRYRVYLAVMPSEEDVLAKSQLKESDFVAGKAPPPPQVARIPAEVSRYYSALTTDWVREVTTSSNEFDFDLSAK